MCKEVPARFVLWLMAFLSYMLQNVLVSNISIAITDMVEKPAIAKGSNISIPHSAETFSWDEEEQAKVLGAAYWLLPIGNIVSGLISHKFSPKLVVGYSIFISSILNMAIPFCANISFSLLLIVRVVLGFVIGLAFPSVLTVVPYWIPENERGKFVSCVVGYNFGSAVVNFLGGMLISLVNWKAVFYLPGFMGVIWCVGWQFLMYDRPEQHPRISNDEKELLASMTATLKAGLQRARRPTPWRKIIFSAHVWINISAQFGCVWTWLSVTSYGPIFLKTIHDLSITMIGLAIGFPFVLRAVACLLYSALTDYLITKKVMSTTNIRKLSITIANVIPALVIIVQVVFENITWVTLTSITLVVLCTGMNINGGIAGLIDISPNFGGAIQGVGGSISLAGGFLIPILIGHLTLKNNTIGQWRKFFVITSSLCLISGLLFVLTWSSNVKDWDGDKTNKEIYAQELRELKKDKAKKISSDNNSCA